MTHTTVIAEPGSTAHGHLATMLRQIDVAAECGVDCFKSQWTSNAVEMVRRRNAPEYLRCYRWLNWPLEWHAHLRDRCRHKRIQYGCSIYLAADAAAVAPYVDVIKVSSFEAADPVMIMAVCASGRRVYVSAGMGSDIPTHDIPGAHSLHRLHCVSAYPAPEEQMNLRAVSRCAGLSDHSRQLDMGALAVAAGARTIETHFRLDDCPADHPDYEVAFTPDEFADYIRLIRRAERIMGDGVQRAQPCEQPMMRFRVGA